MPDASPTTPETEDNLIEVSDLHKTLGTQPVLRGVDLKIRRGESLVVLGQSGEGKSVFLKHLIGLITPDSGSIRIDGEEIVGKSERQMASVRRKVGVLFQDGALFDSMTVAENVAFPLRERGIKHIPELLEKSRAALEVVGLAAHMEKMPINISGGMRKRVALARAIITQPECILYDEPTAGLDPIVADSIDHLIRRLQREFQVTSITVTHDMKSMFHIADRVAYLRQGKIYFLGTPQEIQESTDPAIRRFIEGKSDETLKEEAEAAAAAKAASALASRPETE
ncbi:MAG: ABC transporter ATP-binding protein [Verrucomicrobiae bacterium]|nr:ABC transporter ATP-binding protein [Verrucomicrobiae bacterium]MCB1087619.1 ABC transporter ATP-binding protein [Verrucomicrobiae bacterium]